MPINVENNGETAELGGETKSMYDGSQVISLLILTMDFLNEHARDFFIFFVVPLAGLLVEYVFSARRATTLSVLLGLFIFPVIIGYEFTFPRLGVFSEVLFLSCLYSLVSRLIAGKIKTYGSVILSFVLFAVFGSMSVMNNEKVKTTVEKKWEAGHFKVEYLSNQSFDGGPMLQYALYEYATIPFYLKQLEIASEPEDMSACPVTFPRSGMVFDRCHGKISPVPVKLHSLRRTKKPRGREAYKFSFAVEGGLEPPRSS